MSGTLLAGVAATNTAAAQTGLIPVEYGGGGLVAPYETQVRSVLRELGTSIDTARDAQERWDANVRSAPMGDAAAFRAAVAQVPLGRSLYFAFEYAGAMSALEPLMTLLVDDPSLLAFHPDLVETSLEGLLTIALIHQSDGDDEGTEASLAAIARIAPTAEVSDNIDPRFVERLDAYRDEFATHVVEFLWEDDCEVRINGAPISGRVATLPSTGVFAQLSCGSQASQVISVGDRTSYRFDLAFDDAVRLVAGAPILHPRASNDANTLAGLCRQAGRSMQYGEMFTVGVTEQAGTTPRSVELGYCDADESTFRAVRVPLNGSEESDLQDAVNYLTSGLSPREAYVWQELSGWQWTGESMDAGTSERVRSRRGVSGWVALPISLAVGASVVGVMFELERQDALDALNACSGTCESDGTIVGLRTDVQNPTTIRDVSFVGAGVMAATAITLGVASATRSGRTSVAWVPAPGGGMAVFGWSF